MGKEPMHGWIQGTVFTDGQNEYILGEVWWSGFAKKRIIFVNTKTNAKYEYTEKQFSQAIEEGKIKKL